MSSKMDKEIREQLEVMVKKQPTEEEVEEMMNKPHVFLPLVKFDILLMLHSRPGSSITELIKEFGGQVKESTTDNLLPHLGDYKKEGLVEQTKKDGKRLWSLSTTGKKRFLFLLNRMNNEFHGSGGLKIYRQRKKEEAIRRKNQTI